MCCNRETKINNSKCDNCIAEILQVINVLQQNACPDNCLNSCDRPALGANSNCVVCNTRPIMFYTCGAGSMPFSMPISKSSNTDCTQNGSDCSNVFRIEKIEGCCATCRVLAPNPEPSSVFQFVATNSIFTIDINCICCVRCLNDTHVECL